MPLEPLPENQKGRAAFWQGRVLDLTVHRQADTSRHQTSSLLPELISPVKSLFGQVVPSKIFEVTYCFCNPSIKCI